MQQCAELSVFLMKSLMPFFDDMDRDFDKRDITLPEIREIGEYVAEIKLHPEVIAKVRLNVIPN